MMKSSSTSNESSSLEDIPSDILKQCDSYAFCEACNGAMKNVIEGESTSTISKSSNEKSTASDVKSSELLIESDDHVPLCQSADFCISCDASRKQTEIDAKSSFNSILSDVTCYSYNDCDFCKKAFEMKKQKSNMYHRDVESYVSSNYLLVLLFQRNF